MPPALKYYSIRSRHNLTRKTVKCFGYISRSIFPTLNYAPGSIAPNSYFCFLLWYCGGGSNGGKDDLGLALTHSLTRTPTHAITHTLTIENDEC